MNGLMGYQVCGGKVSIRKMDGCCFVIYLLEHLCDSATATGSILRIRSQLAWNLFTFGGHVAKRE